MVTTKPKCLESKYLPKILGEKRFAELLERSRSAFPIFGAHFDELTLDELKVAILYLVELESERRAETRILIESLKRLEDAKKELKLALSGTPIVLSNPFKPGDYVQLKETIRDEMSEVWHTPGEILQVTSIAADGDGLMFGNLGTHFSNVRISVKPIKKNAHP